MDKTSKILTMFNLKIAIVEQTYYALSKYMKSLILLYICSTNK